MERALVELGRQLGEGVFAGEVEGRLQTLLSGAAGKAVEFSYTAADDQLLSLPLAAARFSGGTLPARTSFTPPPSQERSPSYRVLTPTPVYVRAGCCQAP